MMTTDFGWIGNVVIGMNMELLGGFGGGLMLLGIGWVIFDFFFTRLIKKIYPDPEYWNEELNFPTLSPEDQKSFPRRKRLYQAPVSHRFRKWGIALFLIGGLLVATSAILRDGRHAEHRLGSELGKNAPRDGKGMGATE